MTRRIELPFEVKKPILACGADMKGAFAFAKGDEAFLADGFGGLDELDNFTEYEKSIIKNVKKLGMKPAVIACDLHPNYFSTKFAESFQSGRGRAHLSVPYNCALYQVQHHEAHIASAIVENNIKGNVIGVAFDGTGYGSDGNIWGGEFFIGGLKNFKRVAHLEYVAMPGGEKAVKEPWRMAFSYLYNSFGKSFLKSMGRAHLNVPYIDKDSFKTVIRMIDNGINSPLTSSAGRLFDAVGSLVLGKDRVSREAELPIELEDIALEFCRDRYDFDVEAKGQEFSIRSKKIIKGIVKDLAVKIDNSIVSGKFHNTVSEIILNVSLKLHKKFKIDKVVLSGGVFQNKYLAGRAAELLTANGLKVYKNYGISTNDSGIPIGQIAIANVRAICA